MRPGTRTVLTAVVVALGLVYRVEPHVVAADVYSGPPHTGGDGWTWYTGSAGWMYRAGLEVALGLRREGTTLLIEPCLPRDGRDGDAARTRPRGRRGG